MLQWLSDCCRVFYLGTSSCDLRLISVSECRRAIVSLLNHQCFHALKLLLIYILFARGNAGLWSLTVLPKRASLICILFFSCDIHVWLWTPLPLCSFSPLMTVHASKAAMVLIRLDCDCEDSDWTVTVLLGSVKLVELSWLIGQERIRFIFQIFFPPLFFAIHLFFWIEKLSVCCCWVCVFCNFFAVILHLNFHSGWIMYLITSVKYCRHKYRHDVMIRTCPVTRHLLHANGDRVTCDIFV